MFAEAASPFGRLVGFMFSPILRFASRPYAGRGEHSPEDVARAGRCHGAWAAAEGRGDILKADAASDLRVRVRMAAAETAPAASTSVLEKCERETNDVRCDDGYWGHHDAGL